MRNSTLKAVAASFAAVAVVASLGTSPVLARGGGGGGGLGGGGMHVGGGFHPGGRLAGSFHGSRRFYGGVYNTCAAEPFYGWRHYTYPLSC
jgi:hypothetical protein